MEKRDARNNQNPFPSKLVPLQTLRTEVNFCSLAELKTCLDSAQINSFQKESRHSILKLLEGDPAVEKQSRGHALWGSNKGTKPWKLCNSENSSVLPVGKSGSSSVLKHPASAKKKNLSKSSKKFPSESRKTSTTTSRERALGSLPRSSLVNASLVTQETDIPAGSSTVYPDEGCSETMSDYGEYQTESEIDCGEDDEFAELSDIDGDDSAIVSHCSSSLSWTSLDPKQDEVSESVTTTDSGLGSEADIQGSHRLPLTNSLFKHCPSVLYFPSENEKLLKLPRALQKQLKWKMSTITPNVVKNVIARTGFVASTRRREWIGYWGKHMKASAFRNILPHQKVNHFPGTFEIGRKDKLWKNLSKAQIKHSKKEYDFIPLTFCLPSEWKNFKRYWDETGHKLKWIIKPPASARGIGIKVVHKLNQIPRKRNIIIQKYLASPYLINGRKFDLRIYVYVSSYDPLCIYIYDNGLVRFASSKYSHSSKSLSNRYVHLTNYSVNKYNDAYIKNEDEAGTDSHKWGLKALWKYLQMAGQDVEAVKSKIKAIVIKTIIASVPTVTSLSKSHCKYRHTCHELFGFDIFLDHHLKPWLIEVNISPSLHTSAPLDKHIKYGLVRDLFNVAGFLVPQHNSRTKHAGSSARGTPAGGQVLTMKSEGSPSHEGEPVSDLQLYFNPGICLSSDEKAKHAYFTQRYPTEGGVIERILETLTPDDIRVLMKFQDEVSRKGDLELVFPTEQSAKYLRHFPLPKFYDMLLVQWMRKYGRESTRGVARLQKLALSQVQFSRSPTSADHIYCKQNVRAHKRSDKISSGRKNEAGTRQEECNSFTEGPSRLTTSSLTASSLDLLLRKGQGVPPVTYKPPLPLCSTRPSVRTLNIARSQPGLLIARPSKSRESNKALVTEPARRIKRKSVATSSSVVKLTP